MEKIKNLSSLARNKLRSNKTTKYVIVSVLLIMCAGVVAVTNRPNDKRSEGELAAIIDNLKSDDCKNGLKQLEGIDLSGQSKEVKLEALNYMTYCSSEQKKYDKALQYAEQQKTIIDKSGNEAEKSEIYYIIQNIKGEQALYEGSQQ